MYGSVKDLNTYSGTGIHGRYVVGMDIIVCWVTSLFTRYLIRFIRYLYSRFIFRS